MRMAIGLGMMAALLAAVPAEAVVPLHMQRQNELRRVIDLPAFGRFGPIERIDLIAPDMWRVSSGRCYIDIRRVPQQRRPPGMLPPRLDLVTAQPVCRR
jgi:hypothetical protein